MTQAYDHGRRLAHTVCPVLHPGRVRPPRSVIRGLILATAVILLVAYPLGAQQYRGQGGEEIERLREATELEEAGNLGAAAEALFELLEDEPTSLNGVLALERVLRAQGQLRQLVPVIDRLLEAEPGSSVGRQIQLRTLSFLDDVDALEEAGAEWIEHAPRVETPYREIASVWVKRGDPEQARVVLEEGRETLDRDGALALELGEVHVERGAVDAAVHEWDRAIGTDARGLSVVLRRLNALPDGGARLLPALINALTHSPTTTPRQRAAVELALDAGLERRAEAIARELVEALSKSERAAFLIDVARRADGARLRRLAYWAYTGVLDEEQDRDDQADTLAERAGVSSRPPELLAVRARLGELALTLGDTVAAWEHYRIVEDAYEAGSPERGRATAVRIELIANRGRLDEAVDEFEAYRQEFPEAPELDALGAVLGDALLSRGDAERANEIVAGIDGPRTTLFRGRRALLDGELTEARVALLSAASRLEGREATETLALVSLLGRLSTEGSRLVGAALGARETEGEAAVAAALVTESEELERTERAALLDFAARIADEADERLEAERIRRRIVVDYPDTREAPGALLALARMLADEAETVGEALEFLEQLILEYPRSALVPQARREHERLSDRGDRS